MNATKLVLHIVNTSKAEAIGFSHDDCMAYIDMIGAWLHSVGIADYHYGNLSATEENLHPVFAGYLSMYIDIPEKMSEEAETLLGGMEMSQSMGATGPLALENQDVRVVKIALAAWNVRQKFYRERMEKISSAVAAVTKAVRGNLP